MGIERRRSSAHGLRQFFQNQWEYLSALLERRSADRKAARHRELMEQGAVEAAVDGTNTLLRMASGYRVRLRESVCGLLEHVDELVMQLPAPIDVGAEQFLRDPRVNAFFVNAEAIRDTFSQSHDLQSFFSDPMFTSQSHAFAVMFMKKVEKDVFGAAMVDGVIRQDERKTTVSFTNHWILAPCENEAQLRDALERLLFEKVMAYVNHCLAGLSTPGAVHNDPCPEWAAAATGELPNMKDPEIYLQYLVKALGSHRELLRMKTSTLHVNRIGELVEEGSKQLVNGLELLEIHLGHHTREVLTLVRFPREEMISHDELLRRADARLTY